MSTLSSIEWTDVVWNPVTGCSKVSEGCRNCYAEAVAHRFWGARNFTDVQCHADRLDQPLHWKKPRRIFVNSMSDLFHKDVPDEFIADVFAVMVTAYRQVFQMLTKRPERMRYLLNAPSFREWVAIKAARHINSLRGPHSLAATDSLAHWVSGGAVNVWLGVSIEDQKTVDERIPLLLQTPSAVRWVSAEPLLVAVQLHGWDGEFQRNYLTDTTGKGIDWVVVGGESGPGARPCDVAWIRSILSQCKAAGVPCFVKQLGSQPFVIEGSRDAKEWSAFGAPAFMDDCGGIHTKDRKGGDMAEWPEDLRVREWPR